MEPEQIAKVCHEASRAYCQAIGDDSQVPWEVAPQWQIDSALEGVRDRIANPGMPLCDQHDRWMAHKLASGWVYGEEKDAHAKTHPCIVSYEKLPLEQRLKDSLFASIVLALSPDIDVLQEVSKEMLDLPFAEYQGKTNA